MNDTAQERRSTRPARPLPEIDMGVVRRSHRILSPIVHGYFRSEVRHMERVPDGPTVVITHHDGGVLPINGICFGVAWYDHFHFRRPLYVLSHDVLHFMGGGFAKLLADSGLIHADREMMDAALGSGASVMVFPGAARESFRSYWDRRLIDLGGRKGFIEQAIRWNLPITPVVSAGSHETVFVLWGGHRFARRIGIPKIVRSADVWPLQLGLPWGLWMAPFLPQFPLPAKITTEVLEPVHLSNLVGRPLRREDADDPELVARGFDLVLGRMRAGLDRLYDERRWPVIG